MNIRDDIISLLDKTLVSIENKTIKKRIISCCIELVQNNLKHNKYPAELRIQKANNFFIIQITEQMSAKDIENTSIKISTINNLTDVELKEKYQKNIANNSVNTGNGLIFCKLKSNNPIEHIISKSNSGNIIISKIFVKFRVYENLD